MIRIIRTRTLHVLIIFIIYQTIHSAPNKCKPLPTKFDKRFYHDSEDDKTSSIIFDMYFDL